jgi:hypothetical protein
MHTIVHSSTRCSSISSPIRSITSLQSHHTPHPHPQLRHYHNTFSNSLDTSHTPLSLTNKYHFCASPQLISFPQLLSPPLLHQQQYQQISFFSNYYQSTIQFVHLRYYRTMSTTTTTPSAASTTAAAPQPTPAKTKEKRSKYNDTALHVLKGAIVRVLGPQCAITSSVTFVHPTKGELVVSYEGSEAISAENLAKIQEEINNIIAADLPIQIIEMERKEAEERFTKSPVNHTYIYDKYPIPDTVAQLRICLIENVNVNCCGGEHLSRTGELQKLLIIKTKNRSKKKEYEFEFVCHDAATEYQARQAATLEKLHSLKSKGKPDLNNQTENPSTKSDNKSTATTVNPAFAAEIAATKTSPMFAHWVGGTQTASARTTAEHISTVILPQLTSLLTPDNLKASGINDLNELHKAFSDPKHPLHLKFSESLLPRLDRRLIMYGNECYTEGFNAGKSNGK